MVSFHSYVSLPEGIHPVRVVELNATTVCALPVVQAADGFPVRLEGRMGLDPQSHGCHGGDMAWGRGWIHR